MIGSKLLLRNLSDIEQTEKIKLAKPKRGNDTIKLTEGYITSQQIYEQFLTAKPRANNVKKALRNRALIAALYLTGSRISELLAVTKDQVEVTEDFIILHGIRVLKRKDLYLLDKALPRKGTLAAHTSIFEDYLKTIHKGKPLFPITRQTAWQIVKAETGKWPHYFRAQEISYLINDRKISTLAVKGLTGHKDVSTLEGYAQPPSYKDFKEQLLK